MTTLQQEIEKNLKYNFTIGMADAAFFGIGLGFGSFSTIIPLFFSRMTDSAILIGLIPAIHAVGWQLPQLFTAGWVSRMRKYKPAVMNMTLHERLPYIGLGVVAWLLPTVGVKIALPLAFLMLIWQGLAAGFTANPWQSMIAKIIPVNLQGTFFGTQAAFANVLISVSAIGAGYLLDKVHGTGGFMLTFLICSVGMAISYVFLSFTREPEDLEKTMPHEAHDFWQESLSILKRDGNFRWFLIFRLVYQFATMGFAFYIVYGLRAFNMDAVTAGYLTAALTITQTVANVVMGWLGDRYGPHLMLVLGAITLSLSSLVAWMAPSISWLYLAFVFSGITNVSFWTIGIAMTVQYGTTEERPVYIGLSNTLIAPATIIAPILGGWIADMFGYQTTFMLSSIGGLLTTLVLVLFVRNPLPPRYSLLNKSHSEPN